MGWIYIANKFSNILTVHCYDENYWGLHLQNQWAHWEGL
jgi:hypothetical protein